jgi:LmbE family N-acetylglucosaminyl deacetylase
VKILKVLQKGLLFSSFFLSFPAHSTPVKSVLLVFAHPDDEIMVRSFIARWVENQIAVSAIYLTRGEGGWDHRWGTPPSSSASAQETALQKDQREKKLAAIRGAEMASAAKLYPFAHYQQLSAPDEPLRDPVTRVPTQDASRFLSVAGPWSIEALKKQIEQFSAIVKPDFVVSFYPGQSGTHAHHQAAGMLTRLLYQEHRLGKQVRALYGFYQPEWMHDRALGLKRDLHSPRIEFLPTLLSTTPGPKFKMAYGEMEKPAVQAHESQRSGETANMMEQWNQNPAEVLSPMDEPETLKPLQESLGPIPGLKIIL